MRRRSLCQRRHPRRRAIVASVVRGQSSLIHNLNLVVFAPGGAGRFVGNDFAGTRMTDSINNAEGVVVAKPTLGPWAIQIIAASLKGAIQPYALVISGGF
jgi:hypothetical protein